jgi:hypothetical protein
VTSGWRALQLMRGSVRRPVTESTMRIARLIVLAVTLACQARPDRARQQNRMDSMAVDSIVLVRGPCLGTCPAYRLSIASDGRVHFRSDVPRDQSTATDSISSSSFTGLVREAERIGFASLPRSIRGAPDVCGYAVTDFPTVTTSVFAANRTVIVEDYLACQGPVGNAHIAERLHLLRGFEDAIDSVARAGRWVR